MNTHHHDHDQPTTILTLTSPRRMSSTSARTPTKRSLRLTDSVHAHPLLAARVIDPSHASETRAADACVDACFAPSTLSLSFSAAVTKAVRAYERERAQARDRRGRHGRKGRDEREDARRRRGGLGEMFWLRFGSDAASNEDDEEEGESGESEWDEKRATGDNSVDGTVDGECDGAEMEPPRGELAPLEIPLAALLSASLLKKAGGKAPLLPSRGERSNWNVTDNGFEVVPELRTVIALEDNVETELEPDDPWEYVGDVHANDEEKIPSYADVVAGADLD